MFDDTTSSTLDNEISASVHKVLLQRISFREASRADDYDNLHLKYRPLNPMYKPGQAKKLAVTSIEQGKTNPDGQLSAAPGEMPRPARVLFPLSDVDLHWPDVRRVGPGLANMGNTCFLNSVIQVLTYTAPLANYLLSEKHKVRCKNIGFCMQCELKSHLTRCLRQNANNGAIRPMNIIEKLKCIGKNFRFGHQEDAHEFLRYVIEGIQKADLVGLPKLDKISKETTVANAIFGGFFRSQVKCLHCQHESNTYDPMMDINLNIKDCPTIVAALRKSVQPDRLDGPNKYLCERCRKKVVAQKKWAIHCEPNILTLQLKRFDFTGMFGGKISREVKFPETLDIRPFMSCTQGAPVYYKLYGVLVHSGYSCNSGHYYCYVKASNGTWYEMNDAMVHQVGLHTVMSAQAYILFYIKNKKCGDSPKVNSNESAQSFPLSANTLKVNGHGQTKGAFTTNGFQQNQCATTVGYNVMPGMSPKPQVVASKTQFIPTTHEEEKKSSPSDSLGVPVSRKEPKLNWFQGNVSFKLKTKPGPVSTNSMNSSMNNLYQKKITPAVSKPNADVFTISPKGVAEASAMPQTVPIFTTGNTEISNSTVKSVPKTTNPVSSTATNAESMTNNLPLADRSSPQSQTTKDPLTPPVFKQPSDADTHSNTNITTGTDWSSSAKKDSTSITAPLHEMLSSVKRAAEGVLSPNEDFATSQVKSLDCIAGKKLLKVVHDSKRHPFNLTSLVRLGRPFDSIHRKLPSERVKKSPRMSGLDRLSHDYESSDGSRSESPADESTSPPLHTLTRAEAEAPIDSNRLTDNQENVTVHLVSTPVKIPTIEQISTTTIPQEGEIPMETKIYHDAELLNSPKKTKKKKKKKKRKKNNNGVELSPVKEIHEECVGGSPFTIKEGSHELCEPTKKKKKKKKRKLELEVSDIEIPNKRKKEIQADEPAVPFMNTEWSQDTVSGSTQEFDLDPFSYKSKKKKKKKHPEHLEIKMKKKRELQLHVETMKSALLRIKEKKKSLVDRLAAVECKNSHESSDQSSRDVSPLKSARSIAAHKTAKRRKRRSSTSTSSKDSSPERTKKRSVDDVILHTPIAREVPSDRSSSCEPKRLTEETDVPLQVRKASAVPVHVWDDKVTSSTLWDGSNKSSVLEELLGGGTKVKTWTDEESSLNHRLQENANEREQEQDDWDDEYDRGKIKKLKTNGTSEEKRFSLLKRNPFQHEQDYRNFHKQNDSSKDRQSLPSQKSKQNGFHKDRRKNEYFD